MAKTKKTEQKELKNLLSAKRISALDYETSFFAFIFIIYAPYLGKKTDTKPKGLRMKNLAYLLEEITKGYKKLTADISTSYKKVKKQKNNKVRIMYIPDEKIKTVQKHINKILQMRLPKPVYLHTGYKKCKILNVVKEHKNSRNAVVLDIKNYYGSVPAERVFNFLTKTCQLNIDVAKSIFKFITYRNTIPIGILTSSLVSFWSCKDVFDEIYDYCVNSGYNMTLYADDIIISGDIKNPNKLISLVQKTISKAGLNLNHRKIRIYGKNKRIMNVHVNSKGRLSVDYKLRRSINYLKAKPILSEQEKLVLQGKLNYARQVMNIMREH